MIRRKGERPATSAPSRRPTLTLPRLWVIVCLGGILIILNLQPVMPNDFWWHAGAGRWIVEHGAIPRTDLFSYTRLGAPVAYQMWLAEVVLYVLLNAGGLPLVILFNTGTIVAAYGLLLRVCARAGGDLRWAALATLAAAAVGVTNWNIRPQTLSLLLLALSMNILDRDCAAASEEGESPQSNGHVVWWLPLTFAVWANGHGGFIFGLALVGCSLGAHLVDWARRRNPFPRRLVLVTAASAGATLLTPLGPKMVDYVLGFMQHPITRSLNTEFMPPTVRTVAGQLFFALAIALVVLLFASRGRPTLYEGLRLLVFGALALLAVRNVIWFGFAAAPTMAASLSRLAAGRRIGQGARAGRKWINVAVGAMIALFVALSLPWFRPWLPLPPDRRGYVSPDTPVESVAFLRGLPQPQRVFHSQSFGSYMIWAIPEVPVFIDTRVELYPPAQWYDYLALNDARFDWETILNRYGVDTLFLQRGEQDALIEAASGAPGWKRGYADEQAVIFLRGTGL